jgi:signal transduction histidine kinase/DNA-binding LacI/PurR family transcriptional regulator/AraC-like DNA-binding protein/DNA-binding LytR/AlgR family response regulator
MSRDSEYASDNHRLYDSNENMSNRYNYHMEMPGTPPLTIGYLTPNIDEGNGLLLWMGIIEQAQAMGVRLVTFAGGELRYPAPFYRYSNQVYDLVDRQQLDGLIIWTSSLAAFVGPEGIGEFCHSYAPLPVIGIGIPLPGIPSVILRSYQGMREAILHLVQVHGKRQIAFIRGPERHRDAQERLRAYQDIVAEYGLEANPDLVTPPCRWVEQDARNAMRLLLEERHVTFDSVVAVNDQLAYGAMTYLQEKGFRLPEDIAIIGFDNNPLGRISSPPLTTVPNRMRERGRQAVRMLLAKIHDEPLADEIYLETSVKVRQSCGCQDPYLVQAGAPPTAIVLPPEINSPIALRAHIISRLQYALTPDEKSRAWHEQFFDAFQASLDQSSDMPFLTTLRDLLRSSAAARLELREWQAILSELRRWIIPLEQGRLERIERAERLIHQGRVMTGEFTTRSKAHQDLQRSRQLNNLHRLRQAISAAETLNQLMDILAENLPPLGVTYGCLALYLDAARPQEGVRVALAFDPNGRQPHIEGEVYIPSTRLIPPDWLKIPGLFNMMVHPLHYGAEQLGFWVVDASALEGASHQVLREQISGAIKSVLLIEQNVKLYQQARHSQELAEEANQLKSRFLSMVSHELLTPMVLLVGLSEMMLHEGIGNRPALPEAYRQDLTRIHASAQQLGSLVRDVLDLARSQLGQLTLVKKPLHLAEVLKPIALVCEQMARSKGLAWHMHIPDHLPQVLGDASRLQQVVLNLVSNAVKFTAQGSVSIRVRSEGDLVTIAVVDTGLSVPLAEQEAIFDEFRQSERTVARGYGGLGIGLAICRQLIELHGGTIGVHSSGAENSGSTFYFSLPALPEISADTFLGQSQQVLILTEQTQRSQPLYQHLERQGYQVRVLDTAQTANWIENIQQAPPGALVLDFVAEEQGWHVIEILNQHPATQNTPIIFYSLLQEQDGGSMLALDYLAKPVAASRLTQILQRYAIDPETCSDQQTVLIVEDDPEILALHTRMVTTKLPACRVLQAHNGKEALECMAAMPPALVLLDLMMPEMDGMTMLQNMQADKRLQGIPVIVLTAQSLTAEEMARLNQSVAAVLSKGVFTTQETITHVEQALARHKRLGSDAQRLVRKVMAFIHEHFAESIGREDLARYAGVSERHLNRCFLQETSMTPLNYLTRYRIQQAKALLEAGQLSITEVMGRVGYMESSHFTRVFHREVGVSPSAYKRGKRATES